MAISKGFIDFVVEQMQGVGPVTAKWMFGGAGLYAGAVFFAAIDSEDRLYLKVDDSNRGDFEARGSHYFAPPTPRPMAKPMPYMSVPEDVLEDPEAMADWARKSIAVAERAKK